MAKAQNKHLKMKTDRKRYGFLGVNPLTADENDLNELVEVLNRYDMAKFGTDVKEHPTSNNNKQDETDCDYEKEELRKLYDYLTEELKDFKTKFEEFKNLQSQNYGYLKKELRKLQKTSNHFSNELRKLQNRV
ncbi:MAG: hypothetical protein KDD45_18235 [Bdellovibrionales bacterium]|nr:hypothetical protein [Bdellovibrionales bacterium]